MLDAAGIEHVRYELVNHHNKLASKCEQFTSENVGYVSMHRFFDQTFTAELIAFAEQHGFEERIREMIVMDAVIANQDRHPGNYGVLVDNANGTILKAAPLFDHNLSLLTYMMKDDDFDAYLKTCLPKIGDDFIATAKSVLNPSLRSTLIALKDFQYEDPGFGYPKWKLDYANKLKQAQIEGVLGSKTIYGPGTGPQEKRNRTSPVQEQASSSIEGQHARRRREL